MAGYDYNNYRSGYSTGNPAGPYNPTRYGTGNTSFPQDVEPVRNSNYGYAADGFPPRAYTDANRVGPQQTYQTAEYTGPAGFGHQYSDYNSNNNGLYRPNGNNIIRNDNYDEHYNRKHDDKYSRKQDRNDNYDEHYNRKHDDKHSRKQDTGLLGPIISMASSQGGNKAKTSRSTWNSSGLPVRGDGRLSIPTDDMERALHYLKESTKSTPWPRT